MLATFKLIVAPGLRRYVLVPLSINGLLFAVGIAYGAHLFSTLRRLAPGLVALAGLAAVAARWAARLGRAVFFDFSLVANLIAAPSTGV